MQVCPTTTKSKLDQAKWMPLNKQRVLYIFPHNLLIHFTNRTCNFVSLSCIISFPTAQVYHFCSNQKRLSVQPKQTEFHELSSRLFTNVLIDSSNNTATCRQITCFLFDCSRTIKTSSRYHVCSDEKNEFIHV